jgi:hypothetical protein
VGCLPGGDFFLNYIKNAETGEFPVDCVSSPFGRQVTFEGIGYWIAIGVAAICTLVVAAGIAGYLWHIWS